MLSNNQGILLSSEIKRPWYEVDHPPSI